MYQTTCYYFQLASRQILLLLLNVDLLCREQSVDLKNLFFLVFFQNSVINLSGYPVLYIRRIPMCSGSQQCSLGLYFMWRALLFVYLSISPSAVKYRQSKQTKYYLLVLVQQLTLVNTDLCWFLVYCSKLIIGFLSRCRFLFENVMRCQKLLFASFSMLFYV